MTSLPKSFRLDGKAALVTGGASHLGYDIASALASAGCSVAVTSRRPEKAAQSAARLAQEFGVQAVGLALDVRDTASIDRAVEEAIGALGKIDILVNNSGGGAGKSEAILTERDVADIREVIDSNLTGTILVTRCVVPGMIERGAGKIINLGSIAGIVGRDRRIYQPSGMKGQPVDYAAAKAGIIGLTRDLAGWLSPMGINVNAISPGGFGPRDLPDDFVSAYGDKTPLGHMGRDGKDILGAALFLASSASDYVTGQNLVVDGGFSIWK
ncbi:SDR family NAD(P)-dependent oxidoreductase [Tropicimonas sp. IMCC6043]|uniref:SDR family NAD(P)-dependent oxidoreductase n=1 Tax=Tropicimonas sp. IMCC6043 TaxID=2510645 RepID=UPI00101C8E38|nr:SDR family oxidoreductase [Tropicimonas sp. IMCC6043]RYH07876.1 SDR family oxidoreductase [Tropicimonas sp. IMCC6043]